MNKAQIILNTAQKFNNSNDMLKDIYGINSNDKFNAIIVAPSWLPEKILVNYKTKVTTLVVHAYFSSYLVEFDNLKLAWIQCASGANNLIDSVLALANSKTDKIIFIGAVGALANDINLGDLVTPLECYSYDGGSLYLSENLENAKFGATVKPHNQIYIDNILNEANKKGIDIKKKTVFCTDSILCEYSFLNFIHSTNAQLIEMETASFYKCLELMDKKGIALLCVSDNSTNNISLVARSEEQTKHFHNSREKNIPELIKIACGIE